MRNQNLSEGMPFKGVYPIAGIYCFKTKKHKYLMHYDYQPERAPRKN